MIEKARHLFIACVVVILTSSLVTVVITAQNNITSVEPVPPLDTPPNKHIVYFVTDDINQIDELVTPQRLEARLGSKTVQTWNEVLNEDAARPIDALVIHSSRLSEVDSNWVRQAYQRGVVISGINISGQQIAELVGNTCIARDGFAADTSHPMFVIVSSSVSGENPEDIAKVLDAQNRSCGEETAEGVTGHVSLAQSRATDLLDSENGFNIFSHQLANYLDK